MLEELNFIMINMTKKKFILILSFWIINSWKLIFEKNFYWINFLKKTQQKSPVLFLSS